MGHSFLCEFFIFLFRRLQCGDFEGRWKNKV
jgi:hypothetical protein